MNAFTRRRSFSIFVVMQIDISETNGVAIAEVRAEGVIFRDAQEAAEVLVNCMYQGADALVVWAENLPEGFFELRSGLAGEVLQKFSTYRGSQ
jgi:hypothetical protein